MADHEGSLLHHSHKELKVLMSLFENAYSDIASESGFQLYIKPTSAKVSLQERKQALIYLKTT